MNVDKLTFSIKDVIVIISITFSLGFGLARFSDIMARIEYLETNDKKQDKCIEELLYINKNDGLLVELKH